MDLLLQFLRGFFSKVVLVWYVFTTQRFVQGGEVVVVLRFNLKVMQTYLTRKAEQPSHFYVP